MNVYGTVEIVEAKGKRVFEIQRNASAFKCAFNPSILAPTLSAITGDKVTIEQDDPYRGHAIFSPDNPGHRVLVMPMRLE